LGTYSIVNTLLKYMLSTLLSPIHIPHSLSYKYSWYIYYLVIIRHEKFNKMLPKAAVLLLVITFGQKDTSIVESLDINL